MNIDINHPHARFPSTVSPTLAQKNSRHLQQNMTETTLQKYPLPQVFRSVYSNSTTAPMLNTVSIQPTLDIPTGEYVILWDDVLNAFKNAVYIQSGGTAVPFLMDKNSQP